MTFHIRKLIAGHTGSWQAKKAPKRDLATTQPKGGIPYQEVNSGTQGLLAGLEFVVRTFSELRVDRGRSEPLFGKLGGKRGAVVRGAAQNKGLRT